MIMHTCICTVYIHIYIFIYTFLIVSTTGYVINSWNSQIPYVNLNISTQISRRPGAFHVAKAVLLAGSTVGVELCLQLKRVGIRWVFVSFYDEG